ncbi:alpha/beta fold hydrolase [Streptomyces rimosus]
MVIGFGDDRIVRPQLVREVAECIPGAAYTELAGCGHYGYLEKPELVNSAIVEFFAGRRKV